MENKPQNHIAPSDESLRTEYTEICKSYHAISDFRAKLLALLPIASGTGIALLLSKQKQPLDLAHIWVIGIFGFLATLGLFFYELRIIQRCKTLIDLGAKLEEKLGLENGQFASRPLPRLWGYIGSESAGWVIYLAMLGAWLYVIIAGLCEGRNG